MQNLEIPPELMVFVPAMLVVFTAIKATPLWKYIRNWVSLLSLLIGLGFSFLAMPEGSSVATIILSGLLLGASQTGLYETVRKKEPLK